MDDAMIENIRAYMDAASENADRMRTNHEALLALGDAFRSEAPTRDQLLFALADAMDMIGDYVESSQTFHRFLARHLRQLSEDDHEERLVQFAALSVASDRSLRGMRAVKARLLQDKDGKAAVMQAIKNEWTNRKDARVRFTAVAFAKEMAKLHRDAVTIEAIKNAQTRWNKEYHPARKVTLN